MKTPQKDKKRDVLKKWIAKMRCPAQVDPNPEPDQEPEPERSSSSGNNNNTTNNNKPETLLDGVKGLIRIRIKKGINLAVRDLHRRSSDPYVVVKLGHQRVKTRVVNKDVNPLWDDDLTLTVFDPTIAVKLKVYDHDTFSKDDKMGYAEFSIKPFYKSSKTKDLKTLPNGTVLYTEVPNGKSNCLAKESCVIWQDGHLIQDLCLRLQNVECGEIELQLRWINPN